MKHDFVIIAVDGGAASGKSSTSRLVAERLNLMHVDTGSHYRAVTYALMLDGVPSTDENAVAERLQTLPLDTVVEGGSARIALGGGIPTAEQLRSEAVNNAVSLYAAVPAVRQFLFDYQRFQAELARVNGFAGLIMEGRDIGSVIFPDATLRVFLEADSATRAQRRAAEGENDAIEARDKIDSSRKTAPLTCPEGAFRIDNSSLSLDQVVDLIESRVKNCE
ncbi:(d)CMP kinase [Cerasicoccus arenae]|uniref:Cytidylate kinase n=1 Tax=Cerasicoccus arenae TaxID=424488 RepID=A0A8J3DF26_9BACT|nr:(d)CMP kinase [Cerasicoccus arenae]MBK1857850.1 (d)CMP kinase [Cerasicoccus arenae]GHC13560.1 cytidylate kinase [Cerasicoccus arenae]